MAIPVAKMDHLRATSSLKVRYLHNRDHSVNQLYPTIGVESWNFKIFF